MTADDIPCARRCVRPGTEDDPQIMPARHGRYCARCWGRINVALIQAPELAQHILGHVTSLGGASDDRVHASKAAPLPFNAAAFADVNELYALLVYWCGIWADYLEQRTPAPAARAWRRDPGDGRTATVTGLPAGSTPEVGSRDVGMMARWLRVRLDTILTLAPEDIDEFDEGIRDVWRMNARWPRIDQPRYAAVPCPVMDCGKRMAVYPPAFEGDDRRIVCDGGHYHPEEEYDHLLLVIQQSRAELAREALKQRRATDDDTETANRVMAHLMAKYHDRKEAQP